METIGIIAAMSQESDALLRFIEEREWFTLGPFRCYTFRLVSRDCWLLTSGMGIARAAQATRALIDVANLQMLASVGIAGAVGTDLEIGDVVNSANTCFLDKQGPAGPLQPLASLSEAAWQAAVQALQPRGARLYHGTAVTTHGSQLVQHQSEQMPNPVLEMETVGIAQVAAERGIPLLSLRAISDGPRVPIPFNLEAAMDEEYNLRMGEIIKAVLSHPQMFLQFRRMGRNTRKAAENAAMALIAALSQPGPVLSK
jgi:adenosylhomocysteine nucleosidase